VRNRSKGSSNISLNIIRIEFFQSKENFFAKNDFCLFREATKRTKTVSKINQMIAAGIYNSLESIFPSSGRSPRTNYTLSTTTTKEMNEKGA